MKYTENYKLLMPDENDFFDVMNDNKNMDMLDTALKELKEDGANHAADQNNPHNVTAAQVGASNPNLLINGDFQVWQRGTEFKPGSFSGKYTSDRWAFYDANKTGRVTKLSDSGGLKYSASAGNGLVLMEQLMNKAQLLGKQLTASIKVKSVTGAAQFNIGSYASISAGVAISETVTVREQGEYSVTRIVPEETARPYIGVVITLTDVTDIEIENVKLEIGGTATLFVPRTYGEELAMCRRYYLKTPLDNRYGGVGMVGEAYTSNMIPPIRFIENMRVPPTARVFSVSKPYNEDGKVNILGTGMQVERCTVLIHGTEYCTVSSEGAFTPGIKYAFGLEADAEIY